MKQPAFQFYTGDWLKDPDVSRCSPRTRGIWMDLICAMHESGRSGKISGTPEQLARIGRCTVEEFLQSRIELDASKAADVSEDNGVVTLVNRRMKREVKARKLTAKRVFRHRVRQSGDECNASVSHSVTVLKQSVSSSSSSSDQDLKEKESPLSPSGRKRKSKTLIPDDWTPTPETLAWCAEHRLPEPDFQRLPFLTYWQGRGEARADWQATFRNWMTSPYRKDRPSGTNRQNSGGYESAQQRKDRRLLEIAGRSGAGAADADYPPLRLGAEGDPLGRSAGNRSEDGHD